MFEAPTPDDHGGPEQEPPRRSTTEITCRDSRLARVRGVSKEAMAECAEALERIAAS